MRDSWHTPILVSLVILVQVLLGLSPETDRLTWELENFPVWLGLVLLLITYRHFPLSDLCLQLLGLHSLIISVGGYYSHGKVPLGNSVAEALGFGRNMFFLVVYFMHGFVPAIFFRELILRTSFVGRSGWLGFLVLCVCVASSVFLDFVGMFLALILGNAAQSFIGGHRGAWDTEWELLIATLGALGSLVFLSHSHDRSLGALHSRQTVYVSRRWGVTRPKPAGAVLLSVRERDSQTS
ncbi:MAG: DUF2238 domain-containing protein [Pedosphaera sp.]|nr:DUF2238 domain-containing protein [Pedosphaera sp.]